MVFEIFIAALMFLLVLTYVLSPLVHFSRFVDFDFQSKNAENLNLKKNEILDFLKDLELDRHTQKVSEIDYRHMRHEIMAQGVQIMKKMEAKASGSALDETPKFCFQCGHSLNQVGKFCSECGAKIQ